MPVRLKQGRERGLSAQAISLALATGVGQALVAVVYILAARNSSTTDFGLIVTAIALGTAFVGFVDFGTNSLWVREIAKQAMNSLDLGQRLVSKIAIAGLVSLLWASVILIWFGDSTLWVAAPIGMSLLVNQSNQVVLRGIAKAETVSLSILTDRAVVIVVFLITFGAGVDPTIALWTSLTAGSVVAAWVGWALTPRNSRPTLRFRLRTNPWKGATHYGLFTLGVSAASLDLPILTIIAGPTASGLYGAVNRWTQPMSLLASAFSSASAPFIARSSSWVEAWAYVTKAIWLPLSAIATAIVLALSAPFVVSILIGDSYIGSAPVLQILAIACIPMIVNQPLSVFLQARGQDRIVAVANVATIVTQLLLVAGLASIAGATGAASALAGTQTLLSIFLISIVFASVRKQELPMSNPAEVAQ
jgi:O-antigen/teichoic acid export membrane protein